MSVGTYPDERLPSVLFLCSRDELGRERAGYAVAFSSLGARLVTLDEFPHASVDVRDLRGLETPSLIVMPDPPVVRLPRGLAEVGVPTATFAIDTFVATRRRVRWSMLFDKVYVFHPGFEEHFRRAGHPDVELFPHSVDTRVFRPARVKDLEVAMIGQLGGSQYRERARFVSTLAGKFRSNDWTRPTPPSEVPTIYGRARIVVNVGRDDFPQDVGIRYCEAMASGAVLLTRLPSELGALGFREGVHFVGFRTPDELEARCRALLSDPAREAAIREAALACVVERFSIDGRAATLLRQAKERLLLAPARAWEFARTEALCADQLASMGQVTEARKRIRSTGWTRPGTRLKAEARVARATIRRLVLRRGTASER